jgi:hypothetical protein
MDGHVEWVRLNDKAPMLTEDLPPNSLAGSEYQYGTSWERHISMYAGMG